ncbi:MAG: carbohydrate kinase family protein [Methanomassiliicoccales archaeon]
MGRRYMTPPLFLCVYGHVALDYIIKLADFPEPNTSVDILEKETYYGGTGANIATIASSLGVPTALCSFVGEDFPDDFLDFMRSRNVDLRELVKIRGEKTPTVWIVSNASNDQIAYVYQGPMRKMDEYEVKMNAAVESDVVHICTGRPSYYLKLMELCKSMGKYIAFDPSQEIHYIWNATDFRKAITFCDAIFVNDSELRRALQHLELAAVEDIAKRVRLLVNTKGKDGCVAYEGGIRRITVPSFDTDKIVDPTGAGDAFRAGFYAGKFRKLPLESCLAAGCATASFIIEAKGTLTNIPSWDDVEKRMERILPKIRVDDIS